MWTDFLFSRCVFYLFISWYATGLALYYPSEEFLEYTFVRPLVYHGRTKRAIPFTNDTAGTHHSELVLKLIINREQYVLDLRLNEELVADNYIFSYQNNGQPVLNKTKREDIDLCQYYGSIRGRPGSRVALSTCRGVRGVLYDDDEVLYIEPADGNTIDSSHFLYKHSDLKINKGTASLRKTVVPGKNNVSTRKRLKRSPKYDRFQGPFNANSRSLYIETVLVVDNTEYKKNGGGLHTIRAKMQDLANIINSIFVPLNIFVALVGVEVWNERDEIPMSTDAVAVLNSFLEYRTKVLSPDMPNDNANLITHQKFMDGVVGKAYVSGMCNVHKSGTVVEKHSGVLGVMAASIAHEIGHTLGMQHDYEGCSCSKSVCVMAPLAAHTTDWSDCSLKSLALFLHEGGDYCLRNKPTRWTSPPRCGDGFVQPGEQCDCGTEGLLRVECLKCCQPNCRLRINAACAGGECCDIKTCQLKTVATPCRSGSGECSLPEYCTGMSQFCPSDVHVMDTTPCDNKKAYCFRGQCRSHNSQCRYLWGPSAVNGHRLCYKNRNFTEVKNNYEYNRNSNTFVGLSEEDEVCGLLQCEQYSNHLEFVLNTGAIHNVINMNDKIFSCFSAMTETDGIDENPSMVPNGAKCGSDKMCFNQRCEDVVSVRHKITKMNSICLSNCSGHGVCNSNGNCHCDSGFAPPFCDQPGAGGSIDSGPASDLKVLGDFLIAMYIIFLGILPTILLILSLIWRVKRYKKQCGGKWDDFKYPGIFKIKAKSETKPMKCTKDKKVIANLKKEDIKIVTVPANETKSETCRNKKIVNINNDSLGADRLKTSTLTKELSSVKTVKNNLILNSGKIAVKNNKAIKCNENIVNVHCKGTPFKTVQTKVKKGQRKADSEEKPVSDKTEQSNSNVKLLRKYFDQPQ